MIDVTVKTLDSQNHQFTVEEDMTVEQFKAHIADTVNIPADTQRIIYCGRVLQDSSKLSEYDVHGKVVHLVQRAPPSQTPRSNSRSSSPQPQQRRVYRPYRMEQGNAMYLGSMAFPGNLMETQGIVPPPPTHSLSGSRLNVARRMLRRAEAVIQQLENPSARPQEQPQNEEQQEDEEVTPVIEARVIVPSNSDPIDEVLNAVQTSIINATANAMTINIDGATASASSGSRSQSGNRSAQRSPNQSGNSTPGGPTPRSSSTENLTSEQRSENNGGLPENALRTTEMADLLTFMGQLQTRFAPFLASYHNFMQTDPEVPASEVRSTQVMLNRVTEVMHFFSHAYHSMSDIIVRVRTPPARPLLCRPILIQHSAVVQTGIPIQVEAQINLSADRPPPPYSAQGQDQATPQQQSQQRPANQNTATPLQQLLHPNLVEVNGATGATGSIISGATGSIIIDAGSNSNHNSLNGGTPTISVQSGLVGLPFLPGTMRVQSFPVEIRAVRPATATPRGQNNNNNTVNAPSSGAIATNEDDRGVPAPPRSQIGSTNDSTRPTFIPVTQIDVSNLQMPPINIAAQPSAPQESSAPEAQSTDSSNSGARPQAGNTYNFNNPNVEFFMEVTPEGITIDSLETTLVGSNQANDFLRGALNGPTPEFLQTIMRMAGQIINQNISTTSAPSSQSNSASTAQSAVSTAATLPSGGDSTNADPTSQPSTDQSSTAASASATAAGQNSQARVNTQTNPTTATSTRSTPRPHVHLAQQAMQGGFDPFLPCNSHHISRRRIQMASANQQRVSQQSSTTASSQRQSQPQPPASQQRQQETTNTDSAARANAQSDMRGFVDLLDVIVRGARRPNEQPREGGEGSQANASMAGDSARAEAQQTMPPSLAQIFRLSTMGNMPDVLGGSSLTLEELLHQFHPEDQYVPGESIITDLIMLFVRNLTIMDLFALTLGGNTEPINRNISEIQNFFRTRICDGNTSSSGIDRGTERLIGEMQPFLESFSSLPSRDRINMVRSVEQLFRIRLPSIINTAVNLSPDTVRSLFDQCLMTAKQLLALTLYVSSTGQQGVEQIYEQIMNRFMQDVSPELQNWTLMTSRIQLRQVLTNLNIPESELQSYIIRNSDPVIQSRQNNVTNEYMPNQDEAMELELDAVVEPTINAMEVTPAAVMLEDSEPLPSVILGSEPWHGQVPEDWVPIITRDAQKQRRQNAQGAFSDAYLSGMPSKRRKIVNNSKPQGSLPQVITESVRQAVTATGLTSAAPLEVVSQAAGASPEIQAAYRNLLRSTVQSNLRDNEDYLPERFPNVANYFNGNHQSH